jgi:hypothetical protein
MKAAYAVAALALAVATAPAVAQNVKITPLGSHEGELCASDRATIFEAATEGGKVRPTSRTAALMKQLRATPYLALGGRTMEFDGQGKCAKGC